MTIIETYEVAKMTWIEFKRLSDGEYKTTYMTYLRAEKFINM